MRRLWMVGMGVSAMLAGGMATYDARAQEKEVRRPGPRVEIMRMLGGGGGRLGVSLEEVGADDVGRLGLSAERGAVVTDVQDGSAAEKAGVQKGDVIVRFGGQEVWSAAQLARLVRETPAGRTVEVEVSRGGSVQKLSVALAGPDRDRLIDLADLPAPPVPPMPPDFEAGPMRGMFRLNQGRKLGLSYQELGDQLARYFKVEGGVLVTAVEEDGPAAKAGIKAGDVIVRVEGKPVKDGGDLREALADAAAGSNATIGVQREGRSMDLAVKLGEAPPSPAARTRRRGDRT